MTITYRGEIYKSVGKLVSELVENGSKVHVVCTSGKKVKSKLEYRVDTGEDTWIQITKFQAKKYLSESQLENIQTFEDCITVIRRASIDNPSFSDRIEAGKELKNMRENIRTDTAMLTIENGPFPTFL